MLCSSATTADARRMAMVLGRTLTPQEARRPLDFRAFTILISCDGKAPRRPVRRGWGLPYVVSTTPEGDNHARIGIQFASPHYFGSIDFIFLDSECGIASCG